MKYVLAQYALFFVAFLVTDAPTLLAILLCTWAHNLDFHLGD